MSTIRPVFAVKSSLSSEGLRSWPWAVGKWQVSRLKGLAIGFLCLCHLPTAHGQLKLSPQAKVSVLTMGPGQELYTSFGHTALWIEDPATGLDNVYNYGTFDFRTEGFYWKFIRGSLPYQLSVYPFRYTIAEAQTDNRWLTEQVLNLTPAQKQRLFDLLEINYRPENRQYFYKFFFDNCSTRPRDAIRAVVGDPFPWPDLPELGGKSFRQWMNDHLDHQPWARLGMNIGIGRPSDAEATREQAMYLPENLMRGLEKARVGGQPLVSETKELFVAQPQTRGLTAGYLQLFLCLLTLPVLVWLYRRHWDRPFWFDKLLLFLTGGIGLLLLFLWFGTDHGVTERNVALLLYSPTHLAAAFLLNQPVHFRWLRWYCLLFSALALGFFVLSPKESQTYVIEFLLMVRLMRLHQIFRNQTSQPQPIHES